MKSANSANSVSDIPRPVLGSLYTRNSVSLNKSTEKVPSNTLVQASQMSLQMPAFQQYSSTLRSCSNTTSESLSTRMYKQHDSHLGFSTGEVGDPPGPPTRSLGGSAVVVSSIPGQGSEGSRSPAARASTGKTCAIPSFESVSTLTVVYIHVGLTELRTEMLPNLAVRMTAGVA